MQVFEFHFNPKIKGDLIFDSFCYEPENIYEKRLGSLYIVGELKNVLPNDLNFLEKISQFIKTRYYNYYLKTPEEALRECLKGLNEFLTREVKKENVNWLGNLKLAVVSLCPSQKSGDGYLNFSKIGDIKIFLLRGGKINEISKGIDFQEIEPYPLKIFSNIVSGKLIEEDLLLILTQEVSSFFVEKWRINTSHNQKTKKNKDLVFSETLLEKIAKIIPFKEKGLKEILKTREKEFLKISGICLLIHFSKKEELKEFFAFREKPKEVSLSKFLLFLKDKLVKINGFLKRKLSRTILVFSQKTVFPKMGLNLRLFPKTLKMLFQVKIPSNLKRSLVLILILILFLLVGFLIFRL